MIVSLNVCINMYSDGKLYSKKMSCCNQTINLIGCNMITFFLIKILQQYCCYSETNVATKKATIVDKSTVNTIMDTFCIFLRKNVWRENS